MGESPLNPCPRCGSTARFMMGGGADRVCAACALEVAMQAEPDTPPDSASRAGEDAEVRSTGWSTSAPDESRRFAGYEILGEIARGGMGVVYRARQLRLGRKVALKMVRAGHLARPEDLGRFRTEAAATARLRHPGIVAIHEIGEEGGQHYYSMDLVEGPSLAEWVRRGPVDGDRAARWLAWIADAVQFAHDHGILHRDLKPSNILIAAGDQPVVTDFGLAKLTDDAGGLDAASTLSGTVLGSPAYMPPEQARGRMADITVRSDVYSLGAILYEVLTGQPPFRGANPMEVLRQVVERQPVAPRVVRPGIPADLETLCLRCLAKEPANRLGSAAELAEELRRFLRGEPILSRPVTILERVVRWYRREPWLAGALSAACVLLAGLAVVTLVAAWRIDRARQRAEGETARANRAEVAARDQLRAALLAQARANRFTGRGGQRRESLAAATAAARIRGGAEVREEAVAALALPDVEGVTGPGLAEATDRIAFDPDREWHVMERPEGGLVLRRTADAVELARMDTGGQRVRGFPVFSPDGSWVAARLADDTLRVWATAGGGLAWRLAHRPYPDRPRTSRFGEDLVFDPRGGWLAVGDLAGGVTFHEPAIGRELRRWDAKLVPRRAAVTVDGARLAVADFTDDTTADVVVVEAATGRELGRIPRLAGARGLCWSPEGDFLAVARVGRVELLRWPGGELHRRLETPDGAAMDLAFDPTGEWLLTHSSRSVFRWWNTREGRSALELTQPVALAARIGVARDFGRIDLVTNPEGQPSGLRTLRFQPAPAYRVLAPPATMVAPQVASSIGTVDFSPDGGWVAVACLDEVHVREVASGAMVARIVRPTQGDWTTARFGADRTTLYVSRRSQGLFRHRLRPGPAGVWEADAGECVDAEDDFMLCAIHRPTGRLALASARKHGAFKLISPEGGVPTARWSAVQAYEIAFSPDGALVVANRVPTAGESGAHPIEVRDARDGTLVRTLDAEMGATARWSVDGRWLLTTSLPEGVDLWRTADWSRGPALPREVRSPNGTFAISPDGEWVAAFNEVETYLVSTRTGEVLTRLWEPPGTHGYVTDMAFGPDGRRLALLRRNGVLALWDLDRVREELAARSMGW